MKKLLEQWDAWCRKPSALGVPNWAWILGILAIIQVLVMTSL